MREAYSHEVISHGFWPGSGPVLEPAFYAYAVPNLPGSRRCASQPRGAFYHGELGEFILPYETVRKAASPEDAIAVVRQQHLRAGREPGALEPSGPRADACLMLRFFFVYVFVFSCLRRHGGVLISVR